MGKVINKDKVIKITKINSEKKIKKTIKQINCYIKQRAKKGYNSVAIGCFYEMAIDLESELEQIIKLYEKNGFKINRNHFSSSDKIFIYWYNKEGDKCTEIK